jgi:hypothetical protein
MRGARTLDGSRASGATYAHSVRRRLVRQGSGACPSSTGTGCARTIVALEPGTGAIERLQDWGEAPDTSQFVGRADELAVLRAWVLQERCRLLGVLGCASARRFSRTSLARSVAPSFERVLSMAMRRHKAVAG